MSIRGQQCLGSGTYIQIIAEYHNLVYFRDANGIFVNLYLPSELSWQQAGETVELRQATRYPEEENSSFTLSLRQPLHFALRFRVPGWSQGASLSASGAACGGGRPGEWAVIEREWQDGDTVTIAIPMRLRISAIDPQHPSRAAIMYGPVVLAQHEACCRRPLTTAPDTSLTKRLVKDGDRLSFRIINGVPERHTRYLQPLYTFPQNWPYFVYFDLHAPTLY